DFRDEKSLRRIGIRYRGLHCGVVKALKPGEFPPPALRHGFAQFLPEITEELERRLRGKLLTHEQHGNAWRQEIDGNGGAYGGLLANIRNALAESPVTHLIVRLQKGYEGLGRQVRARLAAHRLLPIG